MFVGKEGAVYNTFPVSTEDNVTYSEVKPQEGVFGYQFLGDNYYAVVFQKGEWKFAHPFDVDAVYYEQIAEWLNGGMDMPWKYRIAYFLLFQRACTKYRA